MRQSVFLPAFSPCLVPTRQLGCLNKHPLCFEADLLFKCPAAFSCLPAPTENQNVSVRFPIKGTRLWEWDWRHPCILFALVLSSRYFAYRWKGKMLFIALWVVLSDVLIHLVLKKKILGKKAKTPWSGKKENDLMQSCVLIFVPVVWKKILNFFNRFSCQSGFPLFQVAANKIAFLVLCLCKWSSQCLLNQSSRNSLLSFMASRNTCFLKTVWKEGPCAFCLFPGNGWTENMFPGYEQQRRGILERQDWLRSAWAGFIQLTGWKHLSLNSRMLGCCDGKVFTDSKFSISVPQAERKGERKSPSYS